MNLLAYSNLVFGTNISWYSVIVLTGAIVAYLFCKYFYKKDELYKTHPDLMETLFLVAFPCGLLGARIWYILSELDYYLADPISILKVWEGGLAIQGGVLLGAACGIWYANHELKKHDMKLSITLLMDMVIPNILIAQVCGRWGNFFNREVYGACVNQAYVDKNWWMLPEWLVENMRGGYSGGVYIYCPNSEFAQPLFLYEGVLNFIGFILITVVIRILFKKRIDGTLSAFYLIWYGAIRAVLEGFRNEEFIMRWGNLSQSLITSIAYIVLGIAFIISLYLIEYKNTKCVEEIVVETPLKEVEKVEESTVEEPVKVEEKIEENKVKKTSVKKSSTPRKNTNSTKTTTSKKTTTNSTNKKTTTTKKTQTKKTTTKKENN